MTICMMTIGMMTISIMTISLFPNTIMTFILMTVSITLNKNYTQYYNNKDYCTLMHTVLVLLITSLFKAECRKQALYVECHNVKCHYAECSDAECRCAVINQCWG
jgi:hypothetical protein